ncbi:hypothetical protein [Sphingobium fuliginis]|uniref:hypothetical protein n=1 Tax=Sphingobium fuliginis (strain ATCC 27551) TaxID=336203 RepID=UPI0020C7FCAB|nr:hypothetical protein [Sphingobium fuliginis]
MIALPGLRRNLAHGCAMDAAFGEQPLPGQNQPRFAVESLRRFMFKALIHH